MKESVTRIPGITAPRYNAPTEVSAMAPYKTKRILGGMSMSILAPAAMVAVEIPSE